MSEAAKELLRVCSELTDNPKDFLRRVKEKCGWWEVRKGYRKGFWAQKCYRPRHTLATTVLKFSAAAGSNGLKEGQRER